MSYPPRTPTTLPNANVRGAYVPLADLYKAPPIPAKEASAQGRSVLKKPLASPARLYFGGDPDS